MRGTQSVGVKSSPVFTYFVRISSCEMYVYKKIQNVREALLASVMSVMTLISEVVE